MTSKERLRVLGGMLPFFLFFLWAFSSHAKTWPFDQRQILLLKDASAAFPDEAATAQIMDVFVQRGRVRWVTRKGAETQFLPHIVPSDFAWHSSPAVRKLGLRYKVDGLLLLKKIGAEIDLRWYSTIDGLPLFFESLKVPVSGDDEAWKELRRKRIQDWVHGIWNRIPGDGFVVERDKNSLKFEGAKQLGAKEGDEIETLRVLGISRHPVLKTLLDVETSDTGVAKVTSIESVTGTAEVEFEAQIDPIEVGDRYRLLAERGDDEIPSSLRKPRPKRKAEAVKESSPSGAKRVSFFGDTKKMIDLSAYLSFGPISHTEDFSGSSQTLKTRAYNPGVELDALLYFTRAWIVGANVSAAFGSFTSVPSVYGVEKVNSGLTSYYVYGGYRFLFLKQLASPAELRVLAGYRSWSLSMQSLGTNIAPSAKTYSGLDLGLYVGFPLYDRAGAYIHGGRMFATSLSEKPVTSGDGAGSSLWRFGGAVTYNLKKEHQIRVGLNYESAATTFDGQGQRSSASLSTKVTRRVFLVGYSFSY